MFKKLFLIIAGLAFLLPITSLAQSASPAVYVQNIELSKSQYSAGQTVTGTFTLLNGNNTPASNIVYSISLVGDYQENGLAKTLHNSVTTNEPIVLGANETRKVNFSYTLPSAILGSDLGLQIQAQTSQGFKMGWADAKITVSGALAAAKISRNIITVGSKTFNPVDGPTISSKDKAFLSVDITNASAEAMQLAPTIKIYDRTVTGAVLLSTTTATLNLPASMAKPVTSTFVLPTFADKAGVYVGTYQLVDKTGVVRSSSFEFRYIVAGDIATIQTVTSNSPKIKKGKDFVITALYTGVPFNITAGTSSPQQSTATLSVKVYNEKDELVAEGKKENIGLYPEAVTAEVPMKASVSARATRAEVSIQRGGTVLATYKTDLSGDYEAQKIRANTFLGKYGSVIYVLALIIVLLLLAWLAFKAVKNQDKRIVFIVLFLILLALAVYVLSKFRQTYASSGAPVTFIEVSCDDHGNLWYNQGTDASGHTIYFNPATNKTWKWIGVNAEGVPIYEDQLGNSKPLYGKCGSYILGDDQISDLENDNEESKDHPGMNIFINAGSPGSVLAPGETNIQVAGLSNQFACNNQNTHVDYTASFPYDSNGNAIPGVAIQTKTFSGLNISNGAWNSQFSIGTFTAPTTPGAYQMKITAEQKSNWEGTKNGYILLTVGGAAPTVVLYADQNEVVAPSNTGGLNWTSQNATACTASNDLGIDDWEGSKAISGAQPVMLAATTTYSIVCTGPGGTSAPATAVINFRGAGATQQTTATSQLGINPFQAPAPASATLTSYAENVSACTLSSPTNTNMDNTLVPDANHKINYHQTPVSGVSQTTTYTLTCTGYQTANPTPKTQTLTITANPDNSCTGSHCTNGTCDAPYTQQGNTCVCTTGNCDNNPGPVGNAECKPKVKAAGGSYTDATFANINQEVVWTATKTDANTYKWSENGGQTILGTSATYSVRYPTIGQKRMYLSVNGGTFTQCLVSPLPIINNPNFQEF